MEQRHTKSIVQEKSFRFAVEVIEYVRRDQKDHINRVLTRQLLRSGTSIGANVEEALGGQSPKDFAAKLAIAAKEARETGYWLRLISETQPHDTQALTGLLKECDGLLRMLNSIILTTRNKLLSRTQSQCKSRDSELITQNSEFPGDSEHRTTNSELSAS